MPGLFNHPDSYGRHATVATSDVLPKLARCDDRRMIRELTKTGPNGGRVCGAMIAHRMQPESHKGLTVEDWVLNENDVVDAVCELLSSNAWTIESKAYAKSRGDDIVATRNGERLVVEAKGGTSSKSTTSRFGRPIDRGQARDHVAKAVLRSMAFVGSDGLHPAIALPDERNHHEFVAAARNALMQLGIESSGCPRIAQSKQTARFRSRGVHV